MATVSEGDQRAWFLRSTYPVDFPAHEALTKSRSDFDGFIAAELRRRHDDTAATQETQHPATGDDDTYTLVSAAETTTVDLQRDLDAMRVIDDDNKPQADDEPTSRFMDGLTRHGQPPDMKNKMLTENNDVAFRSTKDALVDLFSELEAVVSGPRLRELLEASWAADPLATLKIIFNARSIHLGKSSRRTFYRAAGWLYQNHPLTLVANLRWLSRPVIEKKAAPKDAGDDAVLVEAPAVVAVDDDVDDDERTKFDVKHGVAHGYWKDLLNILALAVNGELHVLGDPRDVLNVENEVIARTMKRRRDVSPSASSMKRKRRANRKRYGTARGRGAAEEEEQETEEKAAAKGAQQGAEEQDTEKKAAAKKTQQEVEHEQRQQRHERRQKRHDAAVEAFNTDARYRALHLTVARLFAEQLQADLAALRGDSSKAKKSISLCGKWAPSHDRFHDRLTFVTSSIAEIMHPRASLGDDVVAATDDRETYLKHAREAYRRDMSALRAHLDIVERHLSDGTYGQIKYDRLPSVAMNTYTSLFAQKDWEHFQQYLDSVAQGKMSISGATLLPSTLIKQARTQWQPRHGMSRQALMEQQMLKIKAQVANGQWNTLVQRIKDSGALSSSIAVCDVSGSMGSPTFPDGTTPMDSAIGLSLLVAEVTEKPFGGAFITFSQNPEVQRIDLSKPLSEKLDGLERANWDMNTDFVGVFERLILPMALEHGLKPEEMVKRIFVFSDMQFDQADVRDARWSTSYERVKGKFAQAGYEMPELVFWNLAGGRAGYGYGGGGDATAPKPVTVTDEGTSLVSGYSQGMLKVFLKGGSFDDDPEAEGEEEEKETETKDETTSAGLATVSSPLGDKEPSETPKEEEKKKKAKMNPLATVKKAIGHKAYDMLAVMD
ncbi:hypothetical protein JDV02_003332 [Purpureocillium takamizusanense]|uniref:Uncharacterized protein n=1 Tax=Purpureocillium takamizusanense TaxID=2060973 RepID=A0A9Q8QC80_9HYPO|nr:uncharacterized protein JDV02_003332 [Purpureocillium takamizusanense]UNI16950.1 hypothetical protein JDV02_003332 [Purpureocillium takamizusanense]